MRLDLIFLLIIFIYHQAFARPEIAPENPFFIHPSSSAELREISNRASPEDFIVALDNSAAAVSNRFPDINNPSQPTVPSGQYETDLSAAGSTDRISLTGSNNDCASPSSRKFRKRQTCAGNSKEDSADGEDPDSAHSQTESESGCSPSSGSKLRKHGVLEATSPKMTPAPTIRKDSAHAIAKHYVVKARSRQAFTLRAAQIVYGKVTFAMASPVAGSHSNGSMEYPDAAKRDVKNHLLFEVSTEAANRVGGIYSVIKSKASVTTAEYGDRYTLIGPLNRASAAVEVEPLTPTNPELATSIANMQAKGIEMVYGRWLIEGAPRILLIDTKTGYRWLDEWKGDLWNTAGIPSPPGDDETNEAVVFGYLVAWFLGEFVSHERKKAIIAHFHEWLAGVALPLTKKRRIDVTTIFTTHATLLGRYLCAGSVDFYNNLQYFDVDAEAGKRGIYHRYCIERAAAHATDVFTTVSHITAYESEHLLKRKPDGVLPNGLNVKKFSAMHEFQNLHQQSKEKIHDFVRGHFYGHNDFEPENTLYFFTAGRYEYRNKGVDMFIESLARLNHRLKVSGSKMTVVAFLIMPAQTHSLTVEALKGQAVIKSLRDTVSVIEGEVGKRLFERALQWHDGDEAPEAKDLLTSQDRIMLRRRLFAMKRSTLPPVVTHNMVNDSEDPVLNQIRRVQLFNHPSDRVKIVFHPEFLNSANPVLPLDYDDFVRGTHLGVFPSYYEPWGYTPAECTVMGVPSITTNLSGFGCYMEELIENASDYGIYIVDRRMKGVDDSVNQLTNFMFDFASKSKRQRINQRNRTERLSDLLDWKRMGMEYVKARQLALRRAYPASFNDDYDEESIFDAVEPKLTRPLSVPGSPRSRSGMMTPGDFASLQEGREGLSTEDYIAWKLP
ncbi:glycogen synthase isoform 1, partial [Peltigera leucophlebia]|nr:glycogen synthase isoform 1 [Peltigera leucophlebia]